MAKLTLLSAPLLAALSTADHVSWVFRFAYAAACCALMTPAQSSSGVAKCFPAGDSPRASAAPIASGSGQDCFFLPSVRVYRKDAAMPSVVIYASNKCVPLWIP